MLVSLVDDILWFFNAAVMFSMLGIGVLFFALGWFFSKENERIGNSLAGIGAVMIIAAMLISALGSNYNAPESWLRKLPVAEKAMMRSYIEKEHRPISLFIFRSIQVRYYMEVHAKAEKERQERREKEKILSPAIMKQLKSLGS